MFSDPLFCKLDSNPRTQKHLSDPEDVPPAYEDQLRDKLAETDPAVAKELAYSLNRLGVDASTIGRNEDGPPAYEQAGQDRRKLTDTDPTAAKELANSLNRLGIDLSAIGRHGDSLRIDEEAVELPRKFVTVEMDPTITKDLANSLDRLGVNMSVLGSNEDASCTAREAGEIHGNNDSSRSSPESEHAGVGSMKTGSFVYSADADNPETAVDSFATNDLDCVQANLNGGGYSMSVHEPTEAASWMEDNWDKPLLNSIRTSGCGGPFAWMLSPTKPALAIFGSHNEPIVVNMAQSLAEASGFPVVIRPDSDNPALTLLARDNDPHNEYVPFNNNAGGNSDERGRDADDEGEGIIEEEHIPGEPGNGGRTDADLDDAEPIENGWEMVDHEPNRNCCAQAPGGGDGGGGGGATMVDYNWESPLHSTKVNLRLKLDTARTYGVTIGYTFKFMINRDAEKPTDRDNLTLPVSQPEVTALVDFKIETVPRESQIDRSYASIGFVVDRSKSISYREL
ncbi:hypothetical protein B0H14DRAFT_264634 [Mycena olivaceomarginata]|nr:hypothetical protein B0H14DRAFT_264634 [Mycena olivaceomarginata]